MFKLQNSTKKVFFFLVSRLTVKRACYALKLINYAAQVVVSNSICMKFCLCFARLGEPQSMSTSRRFGDVLTSIALTECSIFCCHAHSEISLPCMTIINYSYFHAKTHGRPLNFLAGCCSCFVCLVLSFFFRYGCCKYLMGKIMMILPRLLFYRLFENAMCHTH